MLGILRQPWLMGGHPGDPQRRNGHEGVQHHSHPGGSGHVEKAKQVVTSQEAPQHGSGDVSPVEEPHPRYTPWGSLHVPGHGGKGSAHEDGRREQKEHAQEGAHEDARKAWRYQGAVDPGHPGDGHQQEESEDPDSRLQCGVNPEGMPRRGHEPGQKEASQEHAAHERAQKDPKGNARCPDDEL